MESEGKIKKGDKRRIEKPEREAGRRIKEEGIRGISNLVKEGVEEGDERDTDKKSRERGKGGCKQSVTEGS